MQLGILLLLLLLLLGYERLWNGKENFFNLATLGPRVAGQIRGVFGIDRSIPIIIWMTFGTRQDVAGLGGVVGLQRLGLERFHCM